EIGARLIVYVKTVTSGSMRIIVEIKGVYITCSSISSPTSSGYFDIFTVQFDLKIDYLSVIIAAEHIGAIGVPSLWRGTGPATVRIDGQYGSYPIDHPQNSFGRITIPIGVVHQVTACGMIVDNIGIKIPVIDLPEYEPYLRMGTRGTGQTEGRRYGTVGQVAGWIVHGIAITVITTDIVSGNPVSSLTET